MMKRKHDTVETRSESPENSNPPTCHSSRSRRLKSRVAESPTAAGDVCFFVGKDGRGSALGDGDTANADPAYTSLVTAAAAAIESSDCPLRRIVTFSIAKPLLLATLESSALVLFNSGADAATTGWPTTIRFLCSGRVTGFRDEDLELAA